MKSTKLVLFLSLLLAKSAFATVDIDVVPFSQMAIGDVAADVIEESGSKEDFAFKKIEVIDGKPLTAEISSSLDENGRLTFTVEAPKSTTGRSVMKGADLFQLMMAHHDKQVKGIDAVWVYGTNLEMFRAAIQTSGVTLETITTAYANAASKTWTGGQAAKFGFKTIDQIEVTRRFLTSTNEAVLVKYLWINGREYVSAETMKGVSVAPVTEELLLGGDIWGVKVGFSR